jgi:bifunctional DNase/RNase
MAKIAMKVLGISGSQTQSGGYALILKEHEGNRRLPIVIGVAEAQSIAIHLEGMIPPRPITHDLFKTFALVHRIEVREVIITKFHEGVFYAEIVTVDRDGHELVIDARTSDAVALAIRFDCPVFASDQVLSVAGIDVDPDPEAEDESEVFSNEHDSEEDESKWTALTVDELEEMLESAVAAENYELASRIRDEINRRKAENDD